MDLGSVLLLPSNERRVSFLSAALGLMVDLDLGTEHLRWMGDGRFVWGFVRGVAQRKACKVRLCLDVVSDDKSDMAHKARSAAAQQRGKVVVGGGTDPLALIRGVQALAAWDEAHPANGAENGNTNGHEGEVDDETEGGPLAVARPLQPTESWLKIESTGKGTVASGRTSNAQDSNKTAEWKDGYKILYLYAGLMPWVSRDLNQWPVAQAASGVIDVVVQRTAPRGALLSAMNGAENGESFWLDTQHYYKVRAFTAENLDKANQPMFTIDGEAFPFDQFHVEILPRAARFMALDGRFFHSEFVSKTGKGK